MLENQILGLTGPGKSEFISTGATLGTWPKAPLIPSVHHCKRHASNAPSAAADGACAEFLSEQSHWAGAARIVRDFFARVPWGAPARQIESEASFVAGYGSPAITLEGLELFAPTRGGWH
jgi:hypothetical protein